MKCQVFQWETPGVTHTGSLSVVIIQIIVNCSDNCPRELLYSIYMQDRQFNMQDRQFNMQERPSAILFFY